MNFASYDSACEISRYHHNKKRREVYYWDFSKSYHYNLIDVTAETNIAFTDLAARHHLAIGTTSLAFSHTASQTRSFALAVSEALAFSHTALQTRSFILAVSHAIAFSEQNVETESYLLNLLNSIVFSHIGIGGKVYNLSINDSILLVSDPKGLPGYFPTTNIVFSHLASPAGSIFNVSVQHIINFIHSAKRVIDLAVLQSIGFVSDPTRGVKSEVNDSITIIDVMAGEKIKPGTTQIVFTDAASREAFIRNVTGQTHFVLTDFAFAFTSKVPCDDYAASLGVRSLFSMTYPLVNPLISVDLRPPVFGDSKKLNTSVQVKRTPTNHPRITKVQTQPKVEIFHYTFENLTKAQRDAFMLFQSQTAGKEIGVLDHENVNWRGVIVDPVSRTAQHGRGCQYRLDFTFRGVRL